jgi:hypothetical protein
MAGKMDSDVAEELGSFAISAIGVGDLAASHDIAAVFRALRRAGCWRSSAPSTAGQNHRAVSHTKTSW